MKKYIVCASLCLVCLGFGSCSEDKLEDESVIVDTNVKQTDFDKWIKANFTDPYNIVFKYRYEHNETDLNYYNVPADYQQAVKLAHIVKYACVDAYDQVAGVDFTRKFFPKLFYATGEFEYRNNGTMILGTAEGGKKIFLAGTNHLNKLSTTVESLNTFYLRTIHHEFTHILNQTKSYTAEYQKVNGNLYIGDAWSSEKERRVICSVVSSRLTHRWRLVKTLPRCCLCTSPTRQSSGQSGWQRLPRILRQVRKPPVPDTLPRSWRWYGCTCVMNSTLILMRFAMRFCVVRLMSSMAM